MSVGTFFKRCIAPLASATSLPLCRHRVQAIRISSVGLKAVIKQSKECSLSSH
jgi:hypothetical protein